MPRTLWKTFGGLARMLKRLGFREARKGEYVAFTHRSGRPMIMLPAYEPSEPVQPIHQMMVWKQLTDAGMIKPGQSTGLSSARPKKRPARPDAKPKKSPEPALKTKP